MLLKGEPRFFRGAGGIGIDRGGEVCNLLPSLLIARAGVLRGLDLVLHFALHP
jgi:hypothetical protein